MAKLDKNKRRAQRNRFKLSKSSEGKLRLAVHRTPRHVYVQLIDDAKGVTIASASSLKSKNGGNVEAAKKVGAEIGKAAIAKKLTNVVFDRGQFRYHGRVKAVAEGAREAGLKF